MSYKKVLKDLLRLNRHHISPDMDIAIQKLCEKYKGKIDEHEDDKSLTWRIPPGYKVIKAELKKSNGEIICSHEMNPMHFWSYSKSFTGKLNYSELKEKILYDPDRPEAILFHFRNQYRFWEPDWGISLTYNQFLSLDKGDEFYVDIKTEFYDAPLRQFITSSPKSSKNLILVSHLDHFYQLNDGLASSVLNNEVALELHGKLENLNLCSLNSIEIVGSVYFLKKNKLNFSNTICAISTNGLTLEGNFIFQLSGKENSQINKIIFLFHQLYKQESTLEKFREGWGNDEIAFEVPGVKIPCASLHRGPHKTYHSHLDNFSSFSDTSFFESKQLLKDIIMSVDQNYTIKLEKWNELLCLANPDIDLYIEPAKISGIKKNTNIKKLPLCQDLSNLEIDYLIKNSEKIRNFNNKFQSFLSFNHNSTIVDVAFEFSLPINFIKNFVYELKKKNFISLVYESKN